MPDGSIEHIPFLFANQFQSVVLRNDGNKLEMIALPVQAQFSPVFSILTIDANKDGYEDIVLSGNRSEEHTSELQSLMRISYAVFCLKKKKKTETHKTYI